MYSSSYKPQSQEELEKCQQFACYEIKPIKLTKEQKKMFRLIAIIGDMGLLIAVLCFFLILFDAFFN